MDHFDVLIIGAGQAATPLSYDLAKAGKKVGIAERKFLGGSCVNFGCTPSKAVIASARLAAQMRRAEEYGINVNEPKINFRKVMDRARRIVEESRNGLLDDLNKAGNPFPLWGHARFVGSHSKGYEIKVDDKHVTAETVVLDTGTRSIIPPIPGLRESEPITAGNWTDLNQLPSPLVFLGAGIVALEMAQMYARLGANVTIMESQHRPLGTEDLEISKAVQEALKKDGVTFMCGCSLEEVTTKKDGWVHLRGSSGSIDAKKIFVATGRKPNTDDLNFDSVGVKLDERGIVQVDKHLKAGKNIYAVGDIRGGIQTTHTSWDDYRIVKDHLIGAKKRTTDRVIPYALFTDPQLGRVGLSEEQAKKVGKKYKVGRYDMEHNGRAREEGQETGFCIALVEEETDLLLGATVFAAEAAEMIQPYVDLMNGRAKVAVLRDTVVTHPTYMEAVQGALEAAR